MSELRRWSEEGATAAELSLLEVSRRERAPTQARVRTLGALGLAIAVSTVTGTAVAATSRGGVGLLLKVLGASLLGGGLVVTGLAIHQAHLAATATTTAKPVRAAASVPVKMPAASASTDGVPPATSDPEADVATAPAVASSASPRPTRPEAEAGRLSREVAALERAHQALAAQDPGAALRFLDRYRAEFPSGALGSEATVLRVQALLASGNRAAAQTLADSYWSAHPDSPYARRIQAILHSAR